MSYSPILNMINADSTRKPDEPLQATPSMPPRSASRDSQVVLGIFLAFSIGMLARDWFSSISSARPSTVAVPQSIDVNRASQAELALLPGVGPKLAERIIAERNQHGPFPDIATLQRVPGIGEQTYERLRPYLSVSPHQVGSVSPDAEVLDRKRSESSMTPNALFSRTNKIQPGEEPINVNTASVAELQRLPGIGPVTAAKIVTARELNPFETIEDLRQVKGIGIKILEQIRPFVVVQ